MNTTRSSTTVNSPLNYGYDNEYRLTSATGAVGATNEAFSYDAVGNRLTELGQGTPSVYDDANRLIQDATYTYTYDNNGNMTSKTDIATSLTTTFTYNARNQLTQINGPNLTATFRYDGKDRRIEKNINGVITRYIYDEQNILQEYDGNNTLQASFSHGPGIDETLYLDSVGSGGFTFTSDGIGSTTELLQGGNVVQDYVYDAFGNIVSQTGTTTNPFTYTGREYDSESGLYYYRARYYDPDIGRFIQEDPIGFAGGINYYIYANNNPIIFTDPSGLEPTPDCDPPDRGCEECATCYAKEYTRRYPDADLDNFMRHCSGSCIICKNCLPFYFCSWAAGWGHEWDGLRQGRGFEIRDLTANSYGRECCLLSNNNCEQCCKNQM